MTDIWVPKQGMGMTEATLVEWKVSVGERIALDQIVAMIETDKVEMEVTAPVSGFLVEQIVCEDQDFEVPGAIGRISESGE